MTNVLLIIVDTLRADHLGCYGYQRATSPNIDKMAKEGVLFSNAFSQNNATRASITSILTGMYPISHGVIRNPSSEDREGWLDERVPILAEMLKARDYSTLAVDSKELWFKRGFDSYSLIPGDLHADAAVPEAINLLKGNSQRPFFLFLHTIDPHTPGLAPPSPYDEMFYHDNLYSRDYDRELFNILQSVVYTPEELNQGIARYDGAVAFADCYLGKLFKTLEELGVADDTLIVFTGDHGESLGEHNIFFDHHGLYDPTIHVPLILKCPGRLPGGKSIDGLVQHVDVVPTILELLGIPKTAGMDGTSLMPLIMGKKKEIYSEIYVEEASYQRKRAIRTKKWKFIKAIKPGIHWTPLKELYDLEDDPGEEVNLFKEAKDVAQEIEERLRNWVVSKGVDYARESEKPWHCRYGPLEGQILNGRFSL